MCGGQFRQSGLTKSPELFSHSQTQNCVAAITGGELWISLHRRCCFGDRVRRIVESDGCLVQRVAALFTNPDKTVLLLGSPCSLDNESPRPIGAAWCVGNISS